MATTTKLANQDLTIYDVLTFSLNYSSAAKFCATCDMAHDPDMMAGMVQDLEGFMLNKFIQG